MASEIEAEWQEFLRYKFEGIRIEDRKDFVRFSQRVSVWHQKANGPILTVRILGMLAWFGPTILIAMYGGGLAAFAYFIAAAIPVGVVIWLAYMIFRDRVGLTIYPGRIIFSVGRQETPIAVDDVRNIDVRATGTQNYGIYVWHKNIPILTFSQTSEHNAISLREGIMLAIGVMNMGEIITSEKPAPPPRKRSFDE